MHVRHAAPLSLLALLGCTLTPASTTTSTATTTTTTVATIASLTPYTDSTGDVSTYTSAADIDPTGVFFQALGSNTRTCQSCHQLAQGMSITPAALQTLFTSTSGNDPVFNAIDGANCPTAAAGSSTARSLLLNSGLIRIPVTLPAGAQFTLTVLSDPYGCAISTSPTTGTQIVSVYRRPLPTASLPYISNVMWDTRETASALTSSASFAASLTADLNQQALDAVSTHEQGVATPTAAQLSAILAFEQGLFTAQATDASAGSLSANGGKGGAANLAAQTFYPGINDAFGGDPAGLLFNPNVFSLYTAWAGSSNAQQASINRGQNIFNTAPLTITNVRGINDNAALGSPTTLQGSCSTCHDTPNVGAHSLPLPMDTAVARLAADETDNNIINALGQLSAPTLPIYQITGCTGTNGRPVTYITTDPGHALSTGLCTDVNRMKLPSLRGLAARAPYFHNGSATSLAELVSFYNNRFQMHLNQGQQADLVNFLNAL